MLRNMREILASVMWLLDYELVSYQDIVQCMQTIFPNDFLQANYAAASSNQIHSEPSQLKHKCKSEFSLVFCADSVRRLFASELLTFPF